MKRIKIFYLTTTPKIAGAEKQLFELAKRLNKNNYDIFVCTIMSEGNGELLEKLRDEDIKCGSLNVNHKWQFLKVFKLVYFLKKEKPVIIQSFLFFDNLLSRFFGKTMGIPIIISGQRNVETHRSKLRNLLEKKTIKFSDYVVSNTVAGKEILINREHLSEEKIKVIYNGINLEPVDCLPSNREYLVLGFVGRLENQKGINFLLEALHFLKDKKIKLKIVGDGGAEKNLKAKSKDLGVCDQVEFLGRKENAHNYIKNFDIFVLPSLWEGMPNVILEAMSQEKLVIATDVGGISEMIVDSQNGFLVDSGNSEELAKKINYVLSLSEDEKLKIKKNARKTVEENFSIDKMVKKYEDLYKKILINNKKI